VEEKTSLAALLVLTPVSSKAKGLKQRSMGSKQSCSKQFYYYLFLNSCHSRLLLPMSIAIDRSEDDPLCVVCCIVTLTAPMVAVAKNLRV
jgi:hypothetical protein